MKEKETVEEQFKRLNDESVLPMAIDDGREIFVSMVGSSGKSKKHVRGIYDSIYVTYRDPDKKERTIRYYHRITKLGKDNVPVATQGKSK